MKQKERLDEKVKQERTEPDHHRKIIIKGILTMDLQEQISSARPLPV